MVTTSLCTHNCRGTWKRRNSQNGKLSATYILYKLLLSSCQWQKTDLFPSLFNSRQYNHHSSHDVSMPSLFFIIRSKETIVTDTNIFLFFSCFSQHIVFRRQNMVYGNQRSLGQRSQRLFYSASRSIESQWQTQQRLWWHWWKQRDFFTLFRRM